MPGSARRLRLELPDVPGAGGFLEELAGLLGAAPIEDARGYRLPARRPQDSGPEIEVALSTAPEPALGFVDASPTALPFRLDAPQPTRSRAGERRAIASGCEAESVTLAHVREHIGDRLRGVDHLGLNLPARAQERTEWLAALRAIATRCIVMPWDAEADVAFVVPATGAEERDRRLDDPDAPRKPKLELVRDPVLELPMLGFALDTDLPLDALAERFPAPRGTSRPGNEDFFRTLLLAHPFPGLLISLDLNSRETSAIEITRLLVDAAVELPADPERTSHG